MNNNNNVLWSIIGFVVIAVIVYLAISATVNLFWLVGGGLVGIVVVLVVLGILTNGIGIGTIVSIIILFLLLELIL